MIEWLEHIDQGALLWINGCNSPFFDTVFWTLSKPISLLPIYLVSAYLLLKDHSTKKALTIIFLSVCTVIITDVVSTQVFKEGVKRYRPSHHLQLGPKLHFYEQSPGVFYRGGKYGFFSSHASNLAGFFAFIYPWFLQRRKPWLWILAVVTTLVCYSRMYLGVHYPSDILAGITFGTVVGMVMRRIFKRYLNA